MNSRFIAAGPAIDGANRTRLAERREPPGSGTKTCRPVAAPPRRQWTVAEKKRGSALQHPVLKKPDANKRLCPRKLLGRSTTRPATRECRMAPRRDRSRERLHGGGNHYLAPTREVASFRREHLPRELIQHTARSGPHVPFQLLIP